MVLMQMGSTGQRVVELQVRLNKMANFGFKVDGIYGVKTRDAVTETQQSRPADSENPAVTGSVDDNTWAYIVKQSGPVSIPAYPTSETPAAYKGTKGANVSTENSYIQTGSGAPGPAAEGLIARMKRGFSELEPWKKWAIVGGGLVSVLFAAYALSTKKAVSLSGFVDFINDEPEKCGRAPSESTLEEAEDILPEA